MVKKVTSSTDGVDWRAQAPAEAGSEAGTSPASSLSSLVATKVMLRAGIRLMIEREFLSFFY